MTAQPTLQRTARIPAALTVKELGDILEISAIEVIKRLMTNGVMASINQTIDYDTAAVVAVDLDWDPVEEVAEEVEAAPLIADEDIPDDPASLVLRAPIVTVLGHVDHGKTSLLDAIRSAKVAAGEAGGITQHIGAYQIMRNGSPVTFIDTPGHAAFTAMRARGAQVTDVAVLVVAADDGVMPQTIEAINHVRAAGVPIIVAINKIDLPGANPDRIKQQLTEHNLLVEEYGGDVVTVPVSATKGTGIEDLLDSIALVAEISELKANPNRPAVGVVIEAEMATNKGPVATILVKNGTLRQGDAIIVGEISGKVKAMFNDRGDRLREAGPSVPVIVMGLETVPEAGDRVRVVADERTARQIVEARTREREANDQTGHAHVNLDSLFNEISAGKIKELILILKADVRGSAEAIKSAVERLSNDLIKVKVIHAATGPVSDSDVMLAEASNAIILAFNSKTDASAKKRAESQGIDIRTYSIIYQVLEDIEKALLGMYEPVYKQVIDGHAEVRQLFKSSKLGGIAGCFVIDGNLRRGSMVRVVRKGVEISKNRCEGLKRFQDDVREVQTGYECGIVLAGFDKWQEGDVIEYYHDERVT